MLPNTITIPDLFPGQNFLLTPNDLNPGDKVVFVISTVTAGDMVPIRIDNQAASGNNNLGMMDFSQSETYQVIIPDSPSPWKGLAIENRATDGRMISGTIKVQAWRKGAGSPGCQWANRMHETEDTIPLDIGYQHGTHTQKLTNLEFWPGERIKIEIKNYVSGQWGRLDESAAGGLNALAVAANSNNGMVQYQKEFGFNLNASYAFVVKTSDGGNYRGLAVENRSSNSNIFGEILISCKSTGSSNYEPFDILDYA